MIYNDLNQSYTTKYNINKYMTSLLGLNIGKQEKSEEESSKLADNLDLIYAEDGEGNYDENMDFDKNDKISYIEYLRYCEQNAKEESKNSDTVINRKNKLQFMTTSFGKASNAYNRSYSSTPAGKVESSV